MPYYKAENMHCSYVYCTSGCFAVKQLEQFIFLPICWTTIKFRWEFGANCDAASVDILPLLMTLWCRQTVRPLDARCFWNRRAGRVRVCVNGRCYQISICFICIEAYIIDLSAAAVLRIVFHSEIMHCFTKYINLQRRILYVFMHLMKSRAAVMDDRMLAGSVCLSKIKNNARAREKAQIKNLG